MAGNGGGMAAAGGGYDAEEGLAFESSENLAVVPAFEGLRLKPELLRGVFQYGFEKPSAIQQRAIAPITAGRDVIAQAQSGTGKTSMIAIAMLQNFDEALRECAPALPVWLLLRAGFRGHFPAWIRLLGTARTSRRRCPGQYLFLLRGGGGGCRVQALILSPTRELAGQTEKTINAIGEFLKVQAHCCIGGKSLCECPRGQAAEAGRTFLPGTTVVLCTRHIRPQIPPQSAALWHPLSSFGSDSGLAGRFAAAGQGASYLAQ